MEFACIDFDTPIFAPARFSAFAPANVAILAILLYPSNHPAIVLGGQVINQSYNVLVNYANRSASGAMSTSALVGGKWNANVFHDLLFPSSFLKHCGHVFQWLLSVNVEM